MGVTGLETAFAALHTELVLPGVLDLAVLVERMSAGAAPFGLEPPSLAPGGRGEPGALRPGGRVGGGRRGLGEPLGQLLLRRRARMRGRVLMTVVAGQVAYRQRELRDGGRVSAGEARPPNGRPWSSSTSRRPSARRCPASTTSPAATAALIRGAEAVGIPIVRHRAVSRRAWAHRSGGRRGTCPRASSRSRRSASRRRRPRASTSTGATRRSSAGSRRTCASTRRSSTCSTRASRSTSRSTRWDPGSSATGRSASRRPSARER